MLQRLIMHFQDVAFKSNGLCSFSNRRQSMGTSWNLMKAIIFDMDGVLVDSMHMSLNLKTKRAINFVRARFMKRMEIV